MIQASTKSLKKTHNNLSNGLSEIGAKFYLLPLAIAEQSFLLAYRVHAWVVDYPGCQISLSQQHMLHSTLPGSPPQLVASRAYVPILSIPA
jgi:hypothetical protein